MEPCLLRRSYLGVSRYIASVTSSPRRAALVDQAAETVETYDPVVAASRLAGARRKFRRWVACPGTCVRALKRPIFVQTSRRQRSDCSKRDRLCPRVRRQPFDTDLA
jgi:hypothetical protein